MYKRALISIFVRIYKIFNIPLYIPSTLNDTNNVRMFFCLYHY